MDDPYDALEMEDYRRKAIREGAVPSFEHLGAKRRIQHGLPNIPQPEATMPTTRTLPSSTPRREYDAPIAEEIIRKVPSPEHGGGHSMHTGDNGSRRRG